MVTRAPLIGRADDVRALTTVVDRAAGGLVLVGDAGVGKSTLLAAVREHAENAGYTVLSAVCIDTDGDDAYGMLRRLLAPVAGRFGPGALRAFATGGPAADAALLRAAIIEALRTLADGQPLLLVVDDVQHADRDSLYQLMLIVRGLRQAPVATVLAARGAVPPQVTLPVREVAPLSDAAAAELLDRQPGRPSGWLRGEILRQAGGYPLAVIELTRTVGATPPWADLAPVGRLREAFAARVRALPPPTRRLLRYAAAAWGRDPIWVIMAAAGASEDDLGEWEPAEQQGLIEIVGDQVRFRHPMLRATCYFDATDDERAEAHTRLAERAEEQFQRVWHRAMATPGRDEALAAELEDAADLATRRGELFLAAKALGTAAERSPHEADAARRWAKAVYAAYRAGDPTWAVELHERAAGLDAPADVRGMAACGAALALSHLGRWSAAFDLARDAAEFSSDCTDGQVAVTAAATAATAALFSGRADHRDALPALPALLARPGPSRPGAPGTTGPLGELMIPGETTAAALASVRAIADPTGYTPGSLPAPSTGLAELARQLFTGTIAWIVDDTTLAVSMLRAALTGQRSSAVGSVATRSVLLVSALIDAGHLAEAERTLTEIEDFAAVGGMTMLLSAVTVFRATTLALRGDAAGARAVLESGRAQPDPTEPDPTEPDPTGSGLVHCLALRADGLTALAERDHERAYRAFRAMFTPGGEPGHYLVSPRSVAQLAWSAARTQQHDDARRVLVAVTAAAGPAPSGRLAALLCHARALLSEGERVEGVEGVEGHYRAALADPGDSHRWPLDYAEAQLGYGAWLRRQRRTADAAPHLTEALEVFERLGAEGHADQVRRVLHSTGVSGEVSGFARLTAQQQHIVRLAAAGLTNEQIAARLSISGRTVGSHLYRIYPVLNVANRYQLRNVLPAT